MKFGCAVRGKGSVWSTSSPLIFLQNTRCSTNTYHSRRQKFYSVPDTIRQITSYGQFRQHQVASPGFGVGGTKIEAPKARASRRQRRRVGYGEWCPLPSRLRSLGSVVSSPIIAFSAYFRACLLNTSVLLAKGSFYRAMLCIRGISHGSVSVFVCLRPSVCVCHKSEFY